MSAMRDYYAMTPKQRAAAARRRRRLESLRSLGPFAAAVGVFVLLAATVLLLIARPFRSEPALGTPTEPSANRATMSAPLTSR
jgi:hypothetical protein